MGVPFRQQMDIAAYIAKQKLRGNKRYPLVLMLEPLFQVQPCLPPVAARSTTRMQS